LNVKEASDPLSLMSRMSPDVRRLTCIDARGNSEIVMSETHSTQITISGALLQRTWPLRLRARCSQG
jgi:hypothetical protein